MSIIIHPSPLPDGRRADPKRRAEMSVLDQLAASESSGAAIYEWSAGGGSPELDFALWVENLGRFAIEVKGGQYDIQNHIWFLRLPDGSLQQKPPPAYQTRDGALSMSRVVVKTTGFTIYTIAVLVFPDMDPEARIAALAAGKQVHVVWRGQDLMTRLREIAATVVVHHPPTRDHIENEVNAMMYAEALEPHAQPRQAVAEPDAPTIPTRMDAGGATVVINNHGPLILCFGAPEDMASALASLMPLSPASPVANLQASPALEAADPLPFGGVGGAQPQSPRPPMAEPA